jgi:hypothetical protein
MLKAGDAERMEDDRNAYSILVGKPEGKRLLGGNKCRREDNIGMDTWEIRWNVVDELHLD